MTDRPLQIANVPNFTTGSLTFQLVRQHPLWKVDLEKRPRQARHDFRAALSENVDVVEQIALATE